MADMKIERQIMAKFKPQARLLSQLGDQLIKNESIALIELVKNAYDADANKVSISIDNVDSENDSTITIKDDGIGMPLNIVQNVWLEPGSNHKAKLIAESQKTKKYHRLPIGEKGIGRFGVHKLGNVIEMTTKSENSKEVFIRIDWTEFSEHRYLDDVPITIIERETPEVFCNNTTGTLIIISKLKKKWERGIARNAQRAITSLASPFDGHESFIPTFSIKEKPGWFDGLLKWDDIKEYALFQFNITMEGGYITDFIYKFTPWLTMSKLIPREIDKNDPLVNNYLRLSSYTDKVQSFIDLTNHKIGKIIFKGYVFDQDNFLLKMGVSDKKGFQRFMKDNGGVRVYRDNLRVYDYGEKENDWLSLDHRRFQQPTKAISNNLILGSVYIDREDSSDLEEKTNREGFVDNDAYQAFKSAILHSVELIEILRQSDKKRLKEIYGPTPKSEPVMSILGEAQRYVDEKVVDLDVKKEIKKYLTKIEKDYKNVTENLLKAAGAGLSMSVVVHEVEKIIYEVEKVLKAEKASDRVLSLVKHLSSLIDGYAEIIRRSSQTKENVMSIVDQALFNTEYRLNSHSIEVIKAYKESPAVVTKVTIARNLLIGTLMNIVDNAIYWLDQQYFKSIDKSESFSKKIWINIIDETDYINIVIADNGTGFLVPTNNVIEPFVSGKPGGMGLGLHIASEVMFAQKGRLIFPNVGDYNIPEEFILGATIVLSLKK